MSVKAVYPLDLEGTNPECYIKDEGWALSSLNNTYRCIIPKCAPFYETDLKVTHTQSGKVLDKDVDFYLGHVMLESDNISAQKLYGSIVILDPNLFGEIVIEYRTIGAQYILPSNDILTYLANMVSDPRTTYWENVVGELEQYAPTEHMQHWEDSRNTADLAAAVSKIAGAVKEQADNADVETYQYLDERLAALQSIVDNSKFNEHLVDVGNPHNITAEQTNALPETQAAVNALKVYGKTIQELTAYILSRAIGQEKLDLYFKQRGENLVGKSIVLNDGQAKITNGGTEATVDLSNGSIAIACQHSSRFVTDAKHQNTSSKMTLDVGGNVLTIDSSGNGANKTALKLNGSDIIHAGNARQHLDGIDTSEASIVAENTDTVKVSGAGTQHSPFKAEATMPVASTGKKGISKVVTEASDSEADAVAESVVTEVSVDISEYASKNYKLNGMTLGSNPTLTKTHIGRGNLNNTSDAEKPLSNALQAEVEDLAVVGHKHDMSGMAIDEASQDALGIAKLVSDPNVKDEVGSLATPKLVKDLTGRSAEALSKASTKMPAAAIDVTRYAESGYLPVPAQGSYEGSGIGLAYAAFGQYEESGQWVFLRNGYDISTEGVYYNIFDTDAEGRVTKSTPTVIRYRPPFLPDGVEARFVRRGTHGCFLFEATNGYVYLVLTNGTMDMSKHVGVKIDDMPTTHRNSADTIPIISGGDVYVVKEYFGNSGWCVIIHKCSIADIKSKESLVLEHVRLHGVDIAGNPVTTDNGHDGGLWLANGSTDGDHDPSSILQYFDDGFWTGSKNLRHSVLNWEIAEKDGKFRIFFMARPYFSRSDRSMTGKLYTESLTVDLTTGEVKRDVENGTTLPARVTKTDIENLHRVGGENDGFIGASPNNRTSTLYSNGQYVAIRFYSNQYTPRIYPMVMKSHPDDYFEHLNMNTKRIEGKGTYPELLGNFGSIANVNARGYALLPGNRFVYYQGNSKEIISEFDPDGNYLGWEGFGPTVNRTETDWMTCANYKRVPYFYDGSVEKWEGLVVTRTVREGKAKVNDDLTLSDYAKFDHDTMYRLRDHLRAMAESDPKYTNDIAAKVIDDNITVMLHSHEGCPIFGHYDFVFYEGAEQKSCNRIIFKLDVDNPKNVTSFSNVQEMRHYRIIERCFICFSDANNGNEVFYRGGQSGYVKLKDGRWCIYSNASPMHAHVGNTTGKRWMVIYDPAENKVLGFDSDYFATYTLYQYLFHPKLGMLILKKHNSVTGTLAISRGHSLEDWNNGWGAPMMVDSTSLPEGWQVYFTEEVMFYEGGNEHTLPKTTFDLKQEFPTDHANQTFHFYVVNVEGEANYVVKKELEPDSETQVYIGYCKTGENRITELRINRVTRVQHFRELEDHINDPNAHGMVGWDKDTIGLGLVENKPISHTISLPSFKEVFDTWYRFSHKHDTPGVYPGMANELTSWVYNDASDTISSTINSSSFLGFVSEKKFEDYEFDTEFGITIPSTDDDWIGVVIGFYKDPETGQEHTLTVTRHCHGGNNKDANNLWIIYNWLQGSTEKTIAKLGSKVEHTWNTCGRTRIRAVRTGDSIQITGFPFENGPDEMIEYTLNLNDHPELSVFKGPTQYGYCAYSQPGATFYNLQRPDNDEAQYYASAEAVQDALRKTGDDYIVVQGAVINGETIPVPAGYTRDQCKAWLAMRYFADTNAALDGIVMKLDSNWKVNAVIYNEQDSTGNTDPSKWSGTVPRTYTLAVNYMVIGRKPKA